MTETITFTVPGAPVAKGRARSFVRNGRVAHYTPEKTANYENLVRMAAHQAMQGASPVDACVSLTVRAFLPIPASWSRRKREQAEAAEIFPAVRPDLDNILKAINDGCNGVLWRDDAQVVVLIASKCYGAAPRVEVEMVAEVAA